MNYGENRMLKSFVCATLVAFATAAGSAGAAAYPERAITVVCAFAAGGATDISTRIVGKYLSGPLGQQIVVDNRGGAGGMIAAGAVMRAKPDGYTLLSSSSVFVVTPSLYKNVQYDPHKDFLPIVEFGASPNVMVVHPAGGINGVAELIAMARANPELISYGSPGLGTTPQLAAEVLKLRMKIKMVHIAYTGGAPAVQALLSKQIQMMSASLSSVMPQIAGGLLKPIVQTGKERWPDLPNVPTMAEAGIQDAVSETFQALFAPAGTPPEIVSRLSKEAITVLGQKEVRDALWTAGLKVTASGPDVLRARIAQEVPMWRDIIEKAGIKAE
jgi:tripartite-type tricarboxylate transporter receptor subunit TctC